MNRIHPEVMSAYMTELNKVIEQYTRTFGISWTDLKIDTINTMRELAYTRAQLQAVKDTKSIKGGIFND